MSKKDMQESNHASRPSKFSKAKGFLIKNAFLIVAVAIVLGIVLAQKGTNTTVSGGLMPERIKEISELATIEYRYKDVISIIEEEEFKLFGLWDIDPGEHILIVQYGGIIKLGIDFGKLQIHEYATSADGKTRFRIKLPDTIIISSETPLNSFEIIVNKGIYTQTTVDMGVFFEEAGKRQEKLNQDILDGEIAAAARENAKRQIQAFLESVADTSEGFEIIWTD